MPVLDTGTLEVIPDAAHDLVTRNFYDADGIQTGSLSPSGFLTEYIHDGAGVLLERRAYVKPTNAGLRETGSLQELTAGLQASFDARILYQYDVQGQRIAVLAIG